MGIIIIGGNNYGIIRISKFIEECKDDEELKERLMERCFDGTWKWTNPGAVEDMIDSIV